MNALLEDLKWRGLLHLHTDLDALSERLDAGSVTAYCGFDPSADSLTVGNLVPMVMLKRLHLAGHNPMLLLGGITGLIGDPKPDSERQMLTLDQVNHNIACIKAQVENFIGTASIEVVNNADWLANMTVSEYLRDVGKHFSVNVMMSKDSVDARLSRDVGMSFTEFSYQTLQGYDFYHLLKTKNCELQCAGADQWGNITAGLDYIRKRLGRSAYAFCNPMILKADGTKFGKSESGAVWLDAKKTSPYQFYQFWLNVEDSMVLQYLKVYSFKSHDEIEAIAAEFEANPGSRSAQKALAEELTVMLHGQEALDEAVRASEALFGRGELSELAEATLRGICLTIPHAEITETPDLATALVEVGLVKSKNQAREAINSGGVYVNNVKVEDPANALSSEAFIHGCALIRRGKRNLGALIR